jgi:protein-disulfide isomerase
MFQKGDNVFVSFLELLKVRHTRDFSNRYFNEHPHKYNLLGLSRILSDYGVANAGTRIENKERDLFNIELPFVAHFGNEFIIVNKIDKDKVHYLWNGKKVAIAVSSFIEAWSGIVLLTETTPESSEPSYQEHRKKELFRIFQKAILVAAIFLISGIASITHSLFNNLGITLLLLINLTGVYVGYLLVLKQLHIQSRYADKICSLFHRSDCNNVLESQAAKLWGVFGWSEIGLGYFFSNVLVILFLPHLMTYSALVNILTLPYTVWSVWYQKKKAGQWCPLCLIIQALLWIIFILNGLFELIHLPGFRLIDLLITGCIYAIPVFTLNLVIPQWSKGNRVEQLNQEINSIKANENVLKALLKKQPYYEVKKSDSQILFGNPEAGLFLTILTNPYCNPCAKMHKRVMEFLKATAGKVCIQYIFSSFESSLDFANKHLIAVYLEKDTGTMEQIYSDWFEKGKPLKEAFFADLNLDMASPEIETEFQKHEAWKARTQLRATPTILVNGFQLPNNYRIEDLKYFTDIEIDVNQSLPG